MRITIEEKRAIAHSKPTPRLLAILPRLEGQRCWLKAGGLSFEPSGHNLAVFREAFPDAPQEACGAAAGAAFEASAGASHYKPKTRPYAHQERALAKARTKNAFALFMEQGTGKTKVAIDRAGELFAEGKITGVLVVSKKGVHRQWIVSQLPEHMGCGWSAKYWQSARWQSVGGEPTVGGELAWASINFDGAKTPKGKAACLDFLEAHKGKAMIIADETQEIKNARSARHKALEELKSASASPYRLALTGTPVAKDLTDEWAQLKWLDERILGIRYVTAFRSEYCIMGGFEGRAVIGHKNMERFRSIVDPFTFRATKDELGLEAKVYRKWKIDLAPAQKRAIVSFKQDLLHQIDTGEISSAATAAVAIIKVQQASNGFVVDEDGVSHDLVPPHKNPRLLALTEILEAYPGKTVVWARFRRDIELICKSLEIAGISHVQYHGGTTEKDRSSAVESFLDPEGVRVFVSNPQAGGTGLNLQGGCSHAIYYSNGFNAVDRWQSEDRIHRIGTKGQVVYTDIVAPGSIDAMIIRNLSIKKGISDMAIGEIKEWADAE